MHSNTQQSYMSLRAKLILTFSADYYKETKVQTAPLFDPSPLVIYPNLTALFQANIQHAYTTLNLAIQMSFAWRCLGKKQAK